MTVTLPNQRLINKNYLWFINSTNDELLVNLTTIKRCKGLFLYQETQRKNTKVNL